MEGFFTFIDFIPHSFVICALKFAVQIHNKSLQQLHAQAQSSLKSFTNNTFQFIHIRRELNKTADALANEAISLEANMLIETVVKQSKKSK